MRVLSYSQMTIYGTAVTIGVLALAGSSVGCSNAKWHQTSPLTGDSVAEHQVVTRSPRYQGGPSAPSTSFIPQKDQLLHVRPSRVRGFKTPVADPDNVETVLPQNQTVRVIDPRPKGDDQLIEVQVYNPEESAEAPQKTMFVAKKYLDDQDIQPTSAEAAADRYFMIQNIATEKVRVYQNCAERSDTGACVHRLILETDMTVGEDTPEKTRRSVLGSYVIKTWYKFYEDNARLFPSYFNPNYPKLPEKGASADAWLATSLLPHGSGIARGSFGWYTAILDPDAHQQWTHGTFGRGEDGGRFILLNPEDTEKLYAGKQSRGCTRVENQAIAFMRQILPVGTKIFKIYAREAYRDATLARYKTQAPYLWNWVLTEEGVRSADAPTSSARDVESRKLKNKEIKELESGTFALNQMPHAIPLQGNSGNPGRESGNFYGIKTTDMKGFLVVDEGRLVNYAHPTGLIVGGHADKVLPALILSKDTNLSLPLEKSKKEILQQGVGPKQGAPVINEGEKQ
jgi:hypothetical protein